MIPMRSRREEEIVAGAIENPEDATMELWVTGAGEDLRAALDDATWGQDAIPIGMDLSFGVDLEDELDGAPFELWMEIEGIKVPQVPVGSSEFVPGTAYGVTDVLASSPGIYYGGQSPIKLGEQTDYHGVPPELIARDVALRLPYDPARVRVASLDVPALTYAAYGEQPGFGAEEPTGGVLSRLEESVGYVFRDTVFRGMRGTVPLPLSANDPVTNEYRARDIPDWRPPVRPSERFYDVRAFRRLPDGTMAYEFRERVRHMGTGPRPLAGQTLDIAVEDDGNASAEEIVRVARREAQNHSRAPRVGSLTLPRFDPRIECEDRFAVAARREDRKGNVYEVRYVCAIDAYDHSANLATKVSYTALVSHQERVAVPSLIVPGVSRSKVRATESA